ncbi:MAG: restriction endonuclease subunit S [Betaproteobacteria bacterium]|nr:restriction endonuclease subunit S [Betaproteobacteria bacterium]
MSSAQRLVRLEEVATFTGGSTPLRAKPQYFGGNIPWVKTTDLNNGLIAETEETLTELGLDESSCKIVPANAVLVAMYGGFNQIGRTGLLLNDSAINQALTAILPDTHKLDPAFLLEWLNFRVDYWKRFAGSSRKDPNITKGDVADFPVPSIPVDQQRNATRVLAEWNSAIEKTEQLIAAKERYCTHELSRLISRGHHPHGHVGSFAHEFPERNRSGTWQKVELADIATVWKGQQLNKDAMVEDGAYYALNGGIKPSGRTTEWNCEANTITVSEGGNSCGFVSFNCENFWCGGHCYALKNLAKNVDVHYLFHFLKGKQTRLMALRVGSGLPNIQKSDIEAFTVILPDLTTQSGIARYLSALREEISTLCAYVEKLKEQKRGLMQKLLTGQWRVPAKGNEVAT